MRRRDMLVRMTNPLHQIVLREPPTCLLLVSGTDPLHHIVSFVGEIMIYTI